MADEESTTPEQACEAIQHAFHEVEKQFPDSLSVRALKHTLVRGVKDHGPLLGFSPARIKALAGGGIPKLPPTGGGG